VLELPGDEISDSVACLNAEKYGDVAGGGGK